YARRRHCWADVGWPVPHDVRRLWLPRRRADARHSGPADAGDRAGCVEPPGYDLATAARLGALPAIDAILGGTSLTRRGSVRRRGAEPSALSYGRLRRRSTAYRKLHTVAAPAGRRSLTPDLRARSAGVWQGCVMQDRGGSRLGEDRGEKLVELHRRLVVHFGEAGTGAVGGVGQEIGVVGPERDLLDGSVDEARRRQHRAGRADEIADAAAIGGDHRDAGRDGVDQHQRLGLVLVEGGKQEDVDVLVEARDLARTEAAEIADAVAELGLGTGDQRRRVGILGRAGEPELGVDAALPELMHALQHGADALLARQIAQMADAQPALAEPPRHLPGCDENGVRHHDDATRLAVETLQVARHGRCQN